MHSLANHTELASLIVRQSTPGMAINIFATLEETRREQDQPLGISGGGKHPVAGGGGSVSTPSLPGTLTYASSSAVVLKSSCTRSPRGGLYVTNHAHSDGPYAPLPTKVGTRAMPVPPMGVIEVSMEQCWNERAGKTGDPRENPPNSGIVQYDSHIQKSGREPAGNQTQQFALVGGE
ncbi:hypothetical protein PR048_022686 [Dryococelus australis]|uniref:Uncharacterized protein n=1 Tax=Dryococelus australis TaxID=614101 RepID=A0ABQ9GRZ1_9NEOP|nr:hypothetical protein PR048_022686 [Dryococelus australis]